MIAQHEQHGKPSTVFPLASHLLNEWDDYNSEEVALQQ